MSDGEGQIPPGSPMGSVPSSMIGDFIARELEPIPDPPVLVRPIGDETVYDVLTTMRSDGERGRVLQLRQVRAGSHFVMVYLGNQELDAWAVGQAQTAWMRWLDGKQQGPLTIDLKHWSLVEAMPGGSLAALVGRLPMEKLPAYPSIGEFGSDPRSEDLAHGALDAAEARSYLNHLKDSVPGSPDYTGPISSGPFEIPEHELRDHPVRLVIKYAETLRNELLGLQTKPHAPTTREEIEGLLGELRTAAEQARGSGAVVKRARSKWWGLALLGVAMLGAGVLAGAYFVRWAMMH